MANITAVIKYPNRIIANTTNLTRTQTNAPIELKNNVPGVNQSYLHSLLDVVEDHPQNGDTLVYNSTTDKYEVKSITTTFNVDGGTF